MKAILENIQKKISASLSISFRFSALIILINFGANMIFVLVANFILSDILNDKVSNFSTMPNADSTVMRFLIITGYVLSFGLPTFSAMLHIFPITDYFNHKNLTGEKINRAKRHLLNTPIAQASIAGIGFFTTMIIGFFALYFSGLGLTFFNIVSIILMSLSGFAFVFGIVYYSLEYVVRKYFIHLAFPENILSQIEGTRRISIRSRFLIFYSTVGIFPLFTFFKVILGNFAGEVLDKIFPGILGMLIVFIAIGILTAWLFSAAYQTPLGLMKKATDQISQNNFDIKVNVISVDEIGGLAESINHMATELREKEFMKETFGRVVDPAVRDFLMSGNVHLGGETRLATVLFCDIRGFTTLSEKKSAAQVVEIVNRYFDRMSSCIAQEKGLVNKYIGDAIMAIFNAPFELPDHALAGVRAAFRMRDELQCLNEEFAKEGLSQIQNGIGIHTGPVLAGNIGSTSRMEYTVMGDAVNLASRLEGLCKKVSHNLIISENTYTLTRDKFKFTKLGKVMVKGKQEKITIYGS